MNLIAIALGSVPDVETGRRLHDLGELSDKDAAKVLFHRRKQETGHSEQLRPNQLRLAAMSLVREGEIGPELISHTWQELDEAAMLDSLLASVRGLAQLVSWGDAALPLIGYRALRHGRQLSQLQRPGGMRDLQAELAQGQPAALAPLHEVAHLLGLPGVTEPRPDVWEAMLADDPAEVREALDLEALHGYLIALRLARINQQRPQAQIDQAHAALREHLANRPEPYLQRFLQRWSAD